jgi:hypothetical protein
MFRELRKIFNRSLYKDHEGVYEDSEEVEPEEAGAKVLENGDGEQEGEEGEPDGEDGDRKGEDGEAEDAESEADTQQQVKNNQADDDETDYDIPVVPVKEFSAGDLQAKRAELVIEECVVVGGRTGRQRFRLAGTVREENKLYTFEGSLQQVMHLPSN